MRLASVDDSGILDGEVDVIFLCQVDHYLRDRRTYLRTLEQKLLPGGRIVIVNYPRERDAVESLAGLLGWHDIQRG